MTTRPSDRYIVRSVGFCAGLADVVTACGGTQSVLGRRRRRGSRSAHRDSHTLFYWRLPSHNDANLGNCRHERLPSWRGDRYTLHTTRPELRICACLCRNKEPVFVPLRTCARLPQSAA